MKRKNGKWMKLAVALMLCLCVLPAAAFAVGEREDNGSFSKAQAVKAGEFVSGSLSTSNDEDYYAVTLDRPGYISLTFNHEYIERDWTYWKVTLYNGDKNELVTSGFAGSVTKNERNPIGVPAGTYYLKVGHDYHSSVPYELKLNYTPANDWEQEFNDDFKTADSLTVNSVKHGSLMHSYDEDYYVFRLERPEVVDLSFFHEYIDNSRGYWKLKLFDGANQELFDDEVSGNENIDAEGGLSLAAGTYYLRVESWNHSSIKYDLLVSTRSGVKFNDVKPSDYFYNPVQWAVKKNITSGIGGGQFGPGAPCTRSQAVTFPWHAAGDPEPRRGNQFKDVNSSDYFCKAASWAAENGITSGIGGGKFGPNIQCTRSQIVTFLWKAKGAPQVGKNATFSDVKDSDYFSNAVQWAVQNGITSGIGGGQFGPEFPCTRSQIVTFLHHAYEK